MRNSTDSVGSHGKASEPAPVCRRVKKTVPLIPPSAVRCTVVQKKENVLYSRSAPVFRSALASGDIVKI